VSETPEEQRIPVRGIKGAPSFYANLCLVRTTPEEVILQFGQRNTDDPNQGDAVVTVYTNLWHAKRLAMALLQSIEKYEAIFGELPTDPIAALDPEKLKILGVTDDDN
jgi:hypothetical protein